MKKVLLISSAILAISIPATAQNYGGQTAQTPPSDMHQKISQQQDPVMDQVLYLQTEWAKIKYQIPDESAKLDAIHKLESDAEKITATYSNRAEPKIWEGIILSTDAGIVKGMSALGKVRKAKDLFESSIAQDPHALDGSAYTSLGSLYYQVPGWPVAFGDNEKAEKNLKMALQMNPDGIDPNFFYGDFLSQTNRMDEAKTYLEHALIAPDRPDRALADAGRRQEIKAKLAQINEDKQTSMQRQPNQ